MMTNYNIQTNTNTQKQFLTPIDTATEIYNSGFIPVQLCRPTLDKKEGKEASQTAWNKLDTYDGQTMEDVESAFRDADGVGLLLTDGLAVIDIDARNIANNSGARLASLLGVDTNYNTFGRTYKSYGAIIVKTDPKMLHYKTPKGECEILCQQKSGYQQKVLPPSRIYDKKQDTFDSFVFNTHFDSQQLQYLEPNHLCGVANFIALASYLTTYYPSEGLRDDAAICLMRILWRAGASPDFITQYINILAFNNGDTERASKPYQKQVAKIESVVNPKWQLKKYWPDADADYILELLGVNAEGKKEEEEEIETPRVRDSFIASDFELEELTPQRWVLYRLLPKGDVTLISGDGGTGKTAEVIQRGLMSSVPGAYFHKLFPYGNKPYNSFLVSNEDSKGVLKRRIAVAKKAIREVYPEYAGNFEHFAAESFKQEPLRLVKKKRNGIPEVNLTDIKLLQDLVGDYKVDSLILDPLSTLHLGMNENDNADMDFMIRKGVIAPFCTKMNISVQLISHVAKGTNSNADDIQSSSWANRGATSLVAAARVVVTFNRLTQKKIKEIYGKDIDAQSLFDIQRDYVHVTYGKNNNASVTSGTFLRKVVKKYYNNSNESIDSIYYKEDLSFIKTAADAAAAKEQQLNSERESVVKCLTLHTGIQVSTNYHKWALVDAARLLMDKDVHMKSFAHHIRTDKKAANKKSDAEIEKDIIKSVANKLESMFFKSYQYPDMKVQFCFLNKEERLGKGTIKRWLEMKEGEDVEAATEAAIFNNNVAEVEYKEAPSLKERLDL